MHGPSTRWRGKAWEPNTKASDDDKLKYIALPEAEITCLWKIQERKHEGTPASGRLVEDNHR